MDDFEYEVFACDAQSESNEFKPYNPLNRPDIRYTKPIVAFLGFILMIVIATILVIRLADSRYNAGLCVATDVFVAVIYVCIIGKKAVIWLVKCYQHYAPDKVRLRCVFEPSCSEYMILAVNKYGLFRGVWKGIHRLFRCKPPGGVDYP